MDGIGDVWFWVIEADIGRTLENVAKSVQELSQQCMRTLITSGHQGAVVEMRVILQKMAEFNKSTQASDLKQELTEKMADIRRKVSCLHNLINCLNGTSQKFKIDLKDGLFAVTDILSGVEKHLRKGQGHVLGGGQFEWVDSVLINALKSGDWLLIDNVNFCNPSVLDRLNAMLEPGGRLCINERGVIDGQIPTIKPHPQFRLILAMDPRNGEISRAMRNRGIEIYILGQNEGGDYDEYDVK
ncbi:midasin-like, partial [Tubulanus polymorphus]|uniref:midasin-like n=1 Tax=Tubulanus polymorphus TaxID=672921 RepID=UPI003DA5B7DA